MVVLALPGWACYVREGKLEGRIRRSPRGEDGFGYDPIFEIQDGRTLAEIGEEKNQISHRSRALRAMMEGLEVLHARARRPF